MGIDQAFVNVQRLLKDVLSRLPEIETEADARFQLINRFLTEVLDWQHQDIKTEPHSESGYTDYLLSSAGQARLVVEAKRLGAMTIDTLNPALRTYKIGGPALVSAMPGLNQATRYCLAHGVNYAVLTTGVTWIVFIPMSGVGIPFKDSLAFTFPNFDSILDNFALFYDLLSREGVTQKHYNLQFAKAGGLSITEFEPLIAVTKPEDIHLENSSELARDLEPVFKEFFGSLVAEDKEMILECFVETRESKFADASLEKIVGTLSAQITPLKPTTDNQLTEEIRHAVSSGRGETVVLVGNNGAGKSTFVERFFDKVLDPVLKDKCLVLLVDSIKSTGDADEVSSWVTDELRSALEAALFEKGNPTYDQLQGLYFREYQGWSVGAYKHLYESDKITFKNKFGEFVEDQRQRKTYDYVVRLLEDVIGNRFLLPCIIFDNGDHHDARYQEALFQYSQSLHERLAATFVVMPVTDRSFWRLSKAGPMQTYRSKLFYLPVPPTKEVLEKRIAYLKRKVEEGKNQRQYFLSKGIRLTLENIRGFAACLEEVFVTEDFVSRRISWLGNNNLRKCLDLAQRIIVSPSFSVEDLIKAYIAYGKDTKLPVNFGKFMRALLRGGYNSFHQEYSQFVLNVFAISPSLPTTPLLNLSILKMLIDRAGEDGGLKGYVSVEHARQYFAAMMILEPAIDHALDGLLSNRLIEPYDASDDDIQTSQRVAITHAGRMHFEMATRDPFYVVEMALNTPMRDLDVVEALRQLRAEPKGNEEKVIRSFIVYCVKQDEIFARIPTDAMYDGQRQLRLEMDSKWVKVSGENVSNSPASVSGGYSHLTCSVSTFKNNKGYGFLNAGLSAEVFLHKNDLAKAGIGSVAIGDTLICDVARGPKGPQVISIHSHIPGAINTSTQARAQMFAGAVEFFNGAKGYGFIRTSALNEDIYFSRKSLEDAGIKQIANGTKVSVSVEKGPRGKGYVATSISLAP